LLPINVDAYSGYKANARPMGFELDRTYYRIYALEGQRQGWVSHYDNAVLWTSDLLGPLTLGFADCSFLPSKGPSEQTLANCSHQGYRCAA